MVPVRLLELAMEFMLDLDGIILFFCVGGRDATDDDIVVDELESTESFLLSSCDCDCCLANKMNLIEIEREI